MNIHSHQTFVKYLTKLTFDAWFVIYMFPNVRKIIIKIIWEENPNHDWKQKGKKKFKGKKGREQNGWKSNN